MTQQFELNAEIRTTLGKGDARRMRKDGFIPAVVYGGKQDPQSLTLLHKDIAMTLEHEAAYSQIISLKVNGKPENVVIKAIERHVYKPKIMHVDFLRVSDADIITMNVPLHFIGETTAAGVKSGGTISKLMTEVEVKCLASKLPEAIDVDITELGLDSTLHLSDIKLPNGVNLATALTADNNHGVLSITKQSSSTEAPSEEN